MTPGQVDVAVLSMAAGADLASTHWALERCSGCSEGNPLMSEPALAIAVKAAGVAGVSLGCRELRRMGHPRAAKVLRWGVVAIWMGVAAHNLRKGGLGR